MGVHLSFVNFWGRETLLDRWDSIRHAGDREVAMLLFDVPKQVLNISREEEAYRPDDVEHLRKLIHMHIPHNSERWDLMCDLLTEKAGVYLHVSY